MSHSDRASYFSLFGIDRTQHQPELLSDEALDALSTRVDEEGYEESGEGLWSVAAAIMSGKTMIASIGVAAPLFHTSAQQRKTICRHVAKAAGEISDLIRPPNK